MTSELVPFGVTATDGTRLSYRSEGSGPLLICIPGIGYASWSWFPQLAALAEDFQVVALDNRGTGRSEKPEGPYSIELLADDVICLLRSLGCVENGRKAHLVGASMGGYIALTVAATQPELIDSLVLISTAIGGPGSHGLPDATRDSWQAASSLPPPDYARQTMKLSFRPGWADEHHTEYEDILRRRLEHPTPPHAWSAQFDACEHYLDVGAPSAARYPRCTIIHGTADRVLPFENARLIRQRIPHAAMLRLDGAGHLCWIERAGEVNEAIRSIATASASPRPSTRRPTT